VCTRSIFSFRHHNNGLKDALAIDCYRYCLRYEGKLDCMKAFETIKMLYNIKTTE